MKRVFIFLFITVIGVSELFALKQSDIKLEMTKKIDSVLEVLRNKNSDSNRRNNEIIQIMNNVFDFELMAKVSLGKDAWNALNKEKQREFSEVFERKIKQSYLEKLELYNNQKIKIISLEPYNKNRLQLKTVILGKEGNYEVNYNFYNKSDEWFVYDVDLVGVSIIQTYRQQFAGLLREKSFDEMFEEFKK